MFLGVVDPPAGFRPFTAPSLDPQPTAYPRKGWGGRNGPRYRLVESAIDGGVDSDEVVSTF